MWEKNVHISIRFLKVLLLISVLSIRRHLPLIPTKPLPSMDTMFGHGKTGCRRTVSMLLFKHAMDTFGLVLQPDYFVLTASVSRKCLRNPANDKSHEIITALREIKDGSLWIGTAYNGLRHFKDGKMSVYGLKEGFFDTNVRELFEGQLVTCYCLHGRRCFYFP